MKALALLFALLVVSYAHDEDDSDYNTLCETGYPNPFGDGWFYLGDMSTESYVTSYDNSTGRTYYWNICGYEDNEDLEEICGDDNAVCYAPGGEMSAQAFFPAGSFEALSAEAIENNETVYLMLTYGNGAFCAASGKNSQTTFVLVCDDNASTPIVDSFAYSTDGCDALLIVRSSAACVRDEVPSGCWSSLKGRKWFHIAFWSLISIFSICCCCACIAAIKRRRCRRGQCHTKNNYTELDLHVQKPVSTPAPQPVPQSVAQPGVPQLMNVGGQYFMTVNGVQYPVQLVPAPQYAQYMSQQPAVDAVTPVPLDEQVVDLQNSQIQEDEKLARQLQAQFNQ